MKCPACVKDKKRSIISLGMGTATAVYSAPFYDEAGVYHHHDPNETVADARCSNGHELTIETKTPCPAEGCTFGKEPPHVTEK